MAENNTGNKQETLVKIKKNIQTAYMYQKDNNKRFHEFRKYVYRSSITDQQKTILAGMKKPALEANLLPGYVSRLKGEFAMHEPSIEVSPSDGVPVQPGTAPVVEGYIRHKIYEANKNGFSDAIYDDELTGGFSAFKVYADFINKMGFKRDIIWEKCFDPTLIGFDPMARHSHKGDGQFCFEIYPMTEDDFKRRFPGASAVKYARNYMTGDNIEGFNWSYKNAQHQKTCLVVEYYEKKCVRTRIVELANGKVLTLKQYKQAEKLWEDHQLMEQIPKVINKRWTELETICKYVINENEILEEEDTDYGYLPIIHVVGVAPNLTVGNTNCTYEMTIPYVYHAKGTQDLKNFSMQTLANTLENQCQSKFIIMKEALPQEQDYIDNITNIQSASTIVVNAFNENNPDQPIANPIREVQNVPAPPEVMQTYQVTDPTIQAILGSFTSNLSKHDDDLSGKAVIEISTAGNSAAMPYMMGYLAAIKQGACITVDLMPKVLKEKRSIPLVSIHGDKTYQDINSQGNPSMDYEQGALHVNIEPGMSFNVQKSQAMYQITALMNVSEQFAAFMNSPKGLPVLVDNLTCYGSDQLKEAIPEFLQQQAQQQQQAMQMQQEQMQNDPQRISAMAQMQKVQSDAQIGQMKLQLEQSKQDMQTQIDLLKIKIDKEVADAKLLEIESKISGSNIEQAVKMEELEVSQANHQIDAVTRMAELQEKKHEHEFKLHEALLNQHASHLDEKRLEHEMAEEKRDTKPESKK